MARYRRFSSVVLPVLALCWSGAAWADVGDIRTNRSPFSNGLTPLIILWSPPFADTNYTAVCTAEIANGNVLLPVITARTPASTTVVPTNSGVAGFLDCMAVPDTDPSTLRHARATFIGNPQNITATWNQAFADTNYTAVCTGETANPQQTGFSGVIDNIAPASVTFNNGGLLAGTLHCIGILDTDPGPVRHGTMAYANNPASVQVNWTQQFNAPNYAAVCSNVAPPGTGLSSAITIFANSQAPGSVIVFPDLTSGTADCIAGLNPQFGTQTTLTISPPSPVSAGQVVTLTASVGDVFSEPVTIGTVTFYSGNQVLGTVQAIDSPPTTAILKTRFGPGTYSLTAQYNPNNIFAGSVSTAQPLTVTGTESTISTLSSAPDGGNYDFTLSVFGFGFPMLSGSATLNNLTAGGTLLGTIAIPGPGMNGFQPQQTFGAGTNPYGMATADFNGDGIPDLAVANYNGSDVSVLLGNGDGTFQSPQNYAVGNHPVEIIAWDFDADGNVDLAVTNNVDASVSLLFGNGDGTFRPQTVLDVGGFPVGLVTADFNGDGVPDLAVADSASNFVSVLIGNGDGTFQPQQTFGAGATPIGVAAGDFNGDGIPDLAVTNSNDATISVLLGNGDGTFQPQQTYAVGNSPFGIVATNLRPAAAVDLAVTNLADGTLSVLLGNGNGTFQPQQTYATGFSPYAVAVADLNGDGLPDLATANANSNDASVLLGNGDGTFQPQQNFMLGNGPRGLVAVDLNGDGVPDLAAPNFVNDDNVSVLAGGTVSTGQLTNIPVPGMGTQNVQSTFSPNQANYAGSQSNVVPVQGTGGTQTNTVLVSSLNPSIYLQPVTFTATVTSPVGGSPTGTVTFTDGTNTICSAVPLVPIQNGSIATCTTATLTVRTHNIVATYSGDSDFAPSQSPPFRQVVNLAPTTTALMSSQNPSSQSQPVTFTATVTASSGAPASGNVTFQSDGVNIPDCTNPAMLANGVATCTTQSLAVGSDTILAAFNDPQGNYGNSSARLTQTVRENTADFTLLPISPGSVTVTQTFNNTNDPFFAQTIHVVAQPLNGYNRIVSLSCSVSPPLTGGSCVVNSPSSGSLAQGNLNTTLTISAGSATPLRAYTVTVTGQDDGGLMHTATLNLTVINYATGVRMPPGGGGTTTIMFPGPPGTPISSFGCPGVVGTGLTGEQNFSVIGGVCTFTPPSGTIPGPITVTLSGCTVARLRTHTAIYASFFLGLPGVVLLGALRGRSRHRRKLLQLLGLSLLVFALLLGVGCGGYGQLTPTGNYNVLVQGTGPDGTVYSAVVPVTVTPLK